MPLTDLELKKLKPTGKTRRLFDGAGLYLEVSPAGGLWWRFKFRFLGKEKRLSLGTYPEVGLKDARWKRDDARRLLSQGVDPSATRRAEKAAGAERAANSFEVLAREWFEKHSPGFAPDHASRVLRLFERDLFPALGKRAIAEITPPELLAVLRRIEDRGALDTAHRARANCGQVFRYAIATGRAERDPSADLKGALPPATGDHFAAITEPTACRRIPPHPLRIPGQRGSSWRRSSSRRSSSSGQESCERPAGQTSTSTARPGGFHSRRRSR